MSGLSTKRPVEIETHQASAFSSTSSATKASRHLYKEVLEELGRGSDRYMKALYEVDVYFREQCKSEESVHDEYQKTNMIACETLKSISELALEVVYYDAVIPHSIGFPFLGTGDLRRQSFKFSFSLGSHVGRRGFLKNSVEILM